MDSAGERRTEHCPGHDASSTQIQLAQPPRSGAGTDLGAVLVVGDVANPMDLVLDMPVGTDPRGVLCRFGLVNAQVGDRVDVFGGEALADPSGVCGGGS